MSKAGTVGMTKILAYLRNFFAKDSEVVKTVNQKHADINGNLDLKVVPGAQQLVTDEAQDAEGTFISRTTGGEASIGDGTAVMMQIRGNSVHTGVVQEVLDMALTLAERPEGVDPITAELDKDAFREAVSATTTITLLYTTAWSDDPVNFGVTVTGDPMAGDTITITYVKADRGTIRTATPSGFRSTGYNLYNHDLGYAFVKKYSSTLGFLIAGAWSALQYSETVDGARTTITPASGYFNVPGDGYVWVTDGNDSTTEIYMTWSDWISGRDGNWKAYEEDEIDLSDIMESFPYGLCNVGGVYDEIDFNSALAIRRIDRWAYSAENMETAEESGRPYEADTNYIYIALEEPVQDDIDTDGSYTANDHGLEIFDGTDTAATIIVIYGENLVDKLRRDVLTKSADLVDNLTTNDPTKALSAAQGYMLNSNITQNYATLTKLVPNNGNYYGEAHYNGNFWEVFAPLSEYVTKNYNITVGTIKNKSGTSLTKAGDKSVYGNGVSHQVSDNLSSDTSGRYIMTLTFTAKS